MTKELFVLLVRIPVKAGFENEYLSLINAVIDDMRHETSFVNAVVHRSTEDPTVFLDHARAARNYDSGAITSGVCVPRHRTLAGARKVKQSREALERRLDKFRRSTVNSLYLAQNMPNAKLILYPDANHGSWYEYHEDFVFETNRFLDERDRIATVTSSAAAD